MISHRFKKKERLTHKKYIQKLFSQGKSLRLSLLRLYYLPSSQDTNQVVFSVPKRIVKKSVHRNTIKRRIREAYRVNKHAIINFDHLSTRFFLGYIYIGHKNKQPTYANFLADIKRSMLHLQQGMKT